MRSLLMYQKTVSTGLFLFFFAFSGFAQSIDLTSDLKLVDAVSKQQVHHHEKRDFIFKDQPKTIFNSNPVSLLYGGSLYVYQNFITQHFSASCLYNPSCSEFSKLAVKEFGIFKGGLLTFDRLNRCNRIAATDLDVGTIDLKTHRFNDSVIKYK